MFKGAKMGMNLKQFNPMKVLNHWDTLMAVINKTNPSPISCEIDPSNLCNHNCIWCMYDHFRKTKNEIIPDKILFNLIDDLARGGVKSITFTGGGEPLTHPRIKDALEAVKKNKMECGLQG